MIPNPGTLLLLAFAGFGLWALLRYYKLIDSYDASEGEKVRKRGLRRWLLGARRGREL